MLYITVCVLALLAATDVHGRYLYESTIHGLIETSKIILNWEDALAQCNTEGAVLAAPISEQLREKMIALISVNNHSTPYFINAKIVHSHKLQFVSSEGVSLDDMSVSDMIDELDPREGDCLAMDAHTIRVVSCSMPLPYMYYIDSDTITSSTAPEVIDVTTTDQEFVDETTIKQAVVDETTTEQEVVDETTTEQETISCGNINEGYDLVASLGSCYKYHSEEKNWDEANSICTDEGGYLTILNDEEEARVVHGMYFPAKKSAAYIGLRDYKDNNVFTSVHGDQLETLYNEWHEGHTFHRKMNCGALDDLGKLNEFRCHNPFPFICERDPIRQH